MFSVGEISDADYAKLPVPTKEGKVPFDIPTIDHPCFTSYKIFGDLDCGAPRVVAVHGGPGGGHESIITFHELWKRYGLPVVFYDQIGCGASTHLPQTAGDHDFWQEKVFIDQLNSLLDQLKLRDGPGFHLLGHSWGGMLSSSFAGTRPAGLQRLVLAGANASRELSVKGQLLNRLALSKDIQKTLHDKEAAGEIDDPDYKAATAIYMKKFMWPGDTAPVEWAIARKVMTSDPTVHITTTGKCFVWNQGSLRHWTAIPRLPQIIAPTLVYKGEFDTAHDVSTQPFFDLIPRVRWKTIPSGAHMCHLQPELQDEILTLVGEFLTPEKLAERAGISS